MILYLTHGNGEESIPLKLPASSSQVEEINIRLDDICSGEGNFRISDAKSSVKGLWQFSAAYNTLFRYVITENHMENGKFVIEGHHTQVNEISVSLRKRLLENGMPNEELQALLKPEKEVNAT